MSRGAVHVVDADLHAFADNYLPADRRASILAALETDPAEGRRVADWCSQNEAIRRILGKTAFEPVPVALSLAGTSRRQGDVGTTVPAVEKATPRLVEPAISESPKRHRHRSRTLGRLLSLGVIVGAAGLFGMASGRMGAQLRSQPNGAGARIETATDVPVAAFSSRAIETHRAFAADGQFPVEFGAGQVPRLVQWLERRMGQTVAAPDLRSSGLLLLGGRLVPGPREPAGWLLYQNEGAERFALMFAKADTTGGSGMTYRTAQGTGVVAWRQGGDVLSLSGPPDRARLLAFANAAAAGFKAKEHR